jgi:hypothetical protein
MEAFDMVAFTPGSPELVSEARIRSRIHTGRRLVDVRAEALGAVPGS